MNGNGLWDQHWTAYAGVASSNPAQAYRRQLVFAALALDRAPVPIRLLELGSGQGDFAQEARRTNQHLELVGIDWSDVGVEIARSKCPGARFFQRDLMRPLDLPPDLLGWATHGVCSELLEHVDDPKKILENALPYLAPGCRLIITVPGGPMSAFDRHIGHRAHFTGSRLARTIRDAGFELGAIHRAGFPFFNLYRLTVVARGASLIEDVDMSARVKLGAPAALALRAFGFLFRHNRPDSPFGWQLVAHAVKPTRPPEAA